MNYFSKSLNADLEIDLSMHSEGVYIESIWLNKKEIDFFSLSEIEREDLREAVSSYVFQETMKALGRR